MRTEIDQLRGKATSLRKDAKFDQAERLLSRVLAVCEKAFGPEDAEVSNALNDLSMLQHECGNYTAAVPLFQRSLEIRIKSLGMENRDVAVGLHSLATLHGKHGNYDKAASLNQQSLTILERLFGPEHPESIATLNDLATICNEQGKYPEALSFARRAFAISEKAATNECEVAEALNTLALVYLDQGNYPTALPLFQRSVITYERTIGHEHQSVAKVLNNMATAYCDKGWYAQARVLWLESLRIAEKTLGPTHLEVAVKLNNFATLLQTWGNYEEALAFCQRSVEIAERALGPNHPKVATFLDNLAGCHCSQERFAEAAPLCVRSLKIRARAFGPEHPEVARSLMLLGILYGNQRHYEDARRAIRRALTVDEKCYGKDHLLVGDDLVRLAACYVKEGRRTEALPLVLRSLRIQENAWGPEHPSVVSTLINSILTEVGVRAGVGQEQLARSVQRFAEVFPHQRRYLASQLGFLTEPEALRYIQNWHSDAHIFHSLCGVCVSRKVEDARILGANQLVANKALLEEWQATQATVDADPSAATQDLRGLYHTVHAQLGRLPYGRLDSLYDEAGRRELEAKLAEIAAELARRVGLVEQTIRERNLDLPDIAHSLPSDAALLDFIEYRRYDFAATTNQWQEARYAVYVTLPRGNSLGNLAAERADLGESDPINKAVAIICQRMAAGQYRAQDLQAALERVSRVVYAPLAKHLTNVTRLIICPDGQLSRLPFEMLLVSSGATNRYLIEEKTISYVGSGREIVRLATATKERDISPALVVGNPDFDLDLATTNAASRPTATETNLPPDAFASARTRGLSRSFQGEEFKPLPQSGEEARSVARLLGSNTVLRLGAQAREIDIKSVRSPRVLHLATHGFFLSDQERKSVPPHDSFPRSFNWPAPRPNDWESPLVRCGIALAGANHAMQMTNSAEDGLLTGLEAALLNLQGTELVILSACDTGTGEVKIGEGVMSLRRAFRIAGAETVLASHWPVSDIATSQLMTEFMRRWRAGEPRAKAWREAQLSLMRSKNYSSPYYWAAFTLTGQWR